MAPTVRVRVAVPVVLMGLALTAALPGAAHAYVVTYNGFGSPTGISTAGNASFTTDGVSADGTVMNLTPAIGNQAGAAYLTTPVALGSGDTFSTTFQFRFLNPGGWDPADGITFVLAQATNGLGSVGNGLGYAGVNNSVAIEFDTYNNTNTGYPNDTSSNHVAIDTNGVLTDTQLTNAYNNGSCGFTSGGTPNQNSYLAPGCMSNGDLWTATIGYNGTDLSVTVQDGSSAPDTLISNYAINIANDLGASSAYVGFTGSTGAGWESQNIVNWSFSNTTQLAQVPEPPGLALFASGLLALCGLVTQSRRRARLPRR